MPRCSRQRLCPAVPREALSDEGGSWCHSSLRTRRTASWFERYNPKFRLVTLRAANQRRCQYEPPRFASASPTVRRRFMPTSARAETQRCYCGRSTPNGLVSKELQVKSTNTTPARTRDDVPLASVSLCPPHEAQTDVLEPLPSRRAADIDHRRHVPRGAVEAAPCDARSCHPLRPSLHAHLLSKRTPARFVEISTACASGMTS